MGRKSDLERGSQGRGVWWESGREACEEGEGEKNLICKNQQILHLDENKPSKMHNLECEPWVDWAGLALRQSRAQSAQLIQKGVWEITRWSQFPQGSGVFRLKVWPIQVRFCFKVVF